MLSSAPMMRPPITISIAAVRGMLTGVRRSRPHDWIAELLARAGIAVELLDEDNARVTGEQYVALFRLLMDELDDECMGLMSSPLRRGSFVLVARSALGATTAASALRWIARGFDLLLADIAVEVVEDGTLTGLALSPRAGAGPQQNFAYELLIRVCWRLLAWLHGGKLKPKCFDFCFPQPDYVSIYDKIFPARLRFDRPASVVWFDACDLATPVRRDSRALHDFLRQSPANVVLPWVSERAVGARVQALLRRTCPQWPDLAASAGSLNMAVSTLQRHLAAEGTSFQLLKDRLRRDMAIVRLSTSAVPLSVLAAELGFSDSASFQRAFKGWTGSAPGAYRRFLVTGAAASA